MYKMCSFEKQSRTYEVVDTASKIRVDINSPTNSSNETVKSSFDFVSAATTSSSALCSKNILSNSNSTSILGNQRVCVRTVTRSATKVKRLWNTEKARQNNGRQSFVLEEIFKIQQTKPLSKKFIITANKGFSVQFFETLGLQRIIKEKRKRKLTLSTSDKVYSYDKQPKVEKNNAYYGTGKLPCPDLGPGWQFEQVVRQQGKSAGKYDVYYLSPNQVRLRSKLALQNYVGSQMPLDKFDFNLGRFIKRNEAFLAKKDALLVDKLRWTFPGEHGSGSVKDTDDNIIKQRSNSLQLSLYKPKNVKASSRKDLASSAHCSKQLKVSGLEAFSVDVHKVSKRLCKKSHSIESIIHKAWELLDPWKKSWYLNNTFCSKSRKGGVYPVRFNKKMVLTRSGRQKLGFLSNSSNSAKRRLRCKSCIGCLTPDCGKCNLCRDMPKFGGKGKKKQGCINRRCVTISTMCNCSFPKVLKTSQISKFTSFENLAGTLKSSVAATINCQEAKKTLLNSVSAKQPASIEISKNLIKTAKCCSRDNELFLSLNESQDTTENNLGAWQSRAKFGNFTSTVSVNDPKHTQKQLSPHLFSSEIGHEKSKVPSLSTLVKIFVEKMTFDISGYQQCHEQICSNSHDESIAYSKFNNDKSVSEDSVLNDCEELQGLLSTKKASQLNLPKEDKILNANTNVTTTQQKSSKKVSHLAYCCNHQKSNTKLLQCDAAGIIQKRCSKSEQYLTVNAVNTPITSHDLAVTSAGSTSKTNLQKSAKVHQEVSVNLVTNICADVLEQPLKIDKNDNDIAKCGDQQSLKNFSNTSASKLSFGNASNSEQDQVKNSFKVLEGSQQSSTKFVETLNSNASVLLGKHKQQISQKYHCKIRILECADATKALHDLTVENVILAKHHDATNSTCDALQNINQDLKQKDQSTVDAPNCDDSTEVLNLKNKTTNQAKGSDATNNVHIAKSTDTLSPKHQEAMDCSLGVLQNFSQGLKQNDDQFSADVPKCDGLTEVVDFNSKTTDVAKSCECDAKNKVCIEKSKDIQSVKHRDAMESTLDAPKCDSPTTIIDLKSRATDRAKTCGAKNKVRIEKSKDIQSDLQEEDVRATLKYDCEASMLHKVAVENSDLVCNDIFSTCSKRILGNSNDMLPNMSESSLSSMTTCQQRTSIFTVAETSLDNLNKSCSVKNLSLRNKTSTVMLSTSSNLTHLASQEKTFLSSAVGFSKTKSLIEKCGTAVNPTALFKTADNHAEYSLLPAAISATTSTDTSASADHLSSSQSESSVETPACNRKTTKQIQSSADTILFRHAGAYTSRFSSQAFSYAQSSMKISSTNALPSVQQVNYSYPSKIFKVAPSSFTAIPVGVKTVVRLPRNVQSTSRIDTNAQTSSYLPFNVQSVHHICSSVQGGNIALSFAQPSMHQLHTPVVSQIPKRCAQVPCSIQTNNTGFPGPTVSSMPNFDHNYIRKSKKSIHVQSEDQTLSATSSTTPSLLFHGDSRLLLKDHFQSSRNNSLTAHSAAHSTNMQSVNFAVSEVPLQFMAKTCSQTASNEVQKKKISCSILLNKDLAKSSEYAVNFKKKHISNIAEKQNLSKQSEKVLLKCSAADFRSKSKTKTPSISSEQSFGSRVLRSTSMLTNVSLANNAPCAFSSNVAKSSQINMSKNIFCPPELKSQSSVSTLKPFVNPALLSPVNSKEKPFLDFDMLSRSSSVPLQDFLQSSEYIKPKQASLKKVLLPSRSLVKKSISGRRGHN